MASFFQPSHLFKARNLITVCLVFLFFCVSIISTLFYNITKEKKQLEILNREYYGLSMQTFSVKPSSEKEMPATLYDISKAIPKNSDCAVYYNDDSHIRQIYFEGSYNAPPVISGRFLNSNDFNTDKNVAVVGKDRADEIVVSNNKKYIKYQEKNFEVVGIAGTDKTSALNFTIFVACNKKLFPQKKVFTLDINQKNADALFKNLKDNLSSKNFESEKMVSSDNAYKVLNSNDVGGNMMIAAFICFALSILIVSIEWINYFSFEIPIKRLLGFKFSSIIFNTLLKYLIFAATGIAASLIVQLFMGNLSVFTLLFSLLTTLTTALLVFIPSGVKLKRISVAEALG